MSRVDFVREVDVERSGRVVQLEGMFDISLERRLVREWSVELPLDEREWNIGLVVGPSGSGKTSVLSEVFGYTGSAFGWDQRQSILESFPREMATKDIVQMLSSVGFSSPPAWVQPFHTLSNGEQFRVELARALAESGELCVLDEFTSVVDRTVAKIGSAAVAKFVRNNNKKLVAASCHYDIVEWLQPDWVFDVGSNEFRWECLQRPKVELTVVRADQEDWKLFKNHHYLDAKLAANAKCFMGFWQDRPVVFGGAIPQPTRGADHPVWREHRLVVLPDFQGISIGNRFSEYLGSLFAGKGLRYRSMTANPAMIRYRARSPLWHMERAPSSVSRVSSKSVMRWNPATARWTATFEYVGPACAVSDDCLLGQLLV